jgi:outer membrane usher protein
MPWLPSPPRIELLIALALAFALGSATKRAVAAEDSTSLQLEVFINDNPTNLIGSFTLLDGRRIAARQAELNELGLNPPGHKSPDDLVTLDDIGSLSYRYDAEEQRIYITASDELRLRKSYDASGRGDSPAAARVDYGGVLNYTLLATSGAQAPSGFLNFNGTSAALDGRLFAPFGTFNQSAIVLASETSPLTGLRLDTTFTHSDPQTLMTYRAGDTIIGALAWTRPIRIGGLQIQRNFGLRPDLVTMPLPVVTGSAAVPSTVDVYVNDLKTFSQEVSPGPFRITNIPVVSGNGAASIVVQDSSGRQVTTSLPFYASPLLLAEGITDFSVDGGVPRLSYGTSADTYIDQPVAAASLRHGVSDWLTIESHAETDTRLVNGGVGGVIRTGSVGVLSSALAGSYDQGSAGIQGYLTYETKILGLSLQLSAQRTFGFYDDLASATSRVQSNDRQALFGGLFSYSGPFASVGANSLLGGSTSPPKELYRISLGVPLPFDTSSLSASFVRLHEALGGRSDIITGSWSRALPWDASIFTTAFADLGAVKNIGFFLGMSIPLGGSVTASTSASGGAGGNSLGFDVTRPLDEKPDSVGWRVSGAAGNASAGAVAGSYRSSYGRVDVGIGRERTGTSGTAQVEGSIATLGSGVFLSGRIDDSFAVVDAGVPGVVVYLENRPVAVTDSKGRALVTGLRSYQKNKLAIDTDNLPVDAEISTAQDTIIPADRSGVRVDFAVRTDIHPAILMLTGSDGMPLPVGARGMTEGGEPFVVGYDGQAYVKDLNAANTVTVTLPNGTCRAAFSYVPKAGEQTVISPVVCEAVDAADSQASAASLDAGSTTRVSTMDKRPEGKSETIDAGQALRPTITPPLQDDALKLRGSFANAPFLRGSLTQDWASRLGPKTKPRDLASKTRTLW